MPGHVGGSEKAGTRLGPGSTWAKTKKVNLGTLGKVRGRAVIKDR